MFSTVSFSQALYGYSKIVYVKQYDDKISFHKYYYQNYLPSPSRRVLGEVVEQANVN
jgi:hypothetical protein